MTFTAAFAICDVRAPGTAGNRLPIVPTGCTIAVGRGETDIQFGGMGREMRPTESQAALNIIAADIASGAAVVSYGGLQHDLRWLANHCGDFALARQIAWHMVDPIFMLSHMDGRIVTMSQMAHSRIPLGSSREVAHLMLRLHADLSAPPPTVGEVLRSREPRRPTDVPHYAWLSPSYEDMIAVPPRRPERAEDYRAARIAVDQPNGEGVACD